MAASGLTAFFSTLPGQAVLNPIYPHSHAVMRLMLLGVYAKLTDYTELQPLLSGVHSVMRVKLALAGAGGGARPPPLITFTITIKVAVYAPAEWADTLTLFHL